MMDEEKQRQEKNLELAIIELANALRNHMQIGWAWQEYLENNPSNTFRRADGTNEVEESARIVYELFKQALSICFPPSGLPRQTLMERERDIITMKLLMKEWLPFDKIRLDFPPDNS